MQYHSMSALVLPISLLAYILLPAWLLTRGRLFRAGMAMILAALLPWVVWLPQSHGSWGPGAGIAMMVTAAMLLVALVPVGLGVARLIMRSARACGKRPA